MEMGEDDVFKSHCPVISKCQNKTSAQATEISSEHQKLDWVLEENKCLKEMLDAEKLVNMLSKPVNKEEYSMGTNPKPRNIW